jgi:hypothetical protein
MTKMLAMRDGCSKNIRAYAADRRIPSRHASKTGSTHWPRICDKLSLNRLKKRDRLAKH